MFLDQDEAQRRKLQCPENEAGIHSILQRSLRYYCYNRQESKQAAATVVLISMVGMSKHSCRFGVVQAGVLQPTHTSTSRTFVLKIMFENAVRNARTFVRLSR